MFVFKITDADDFSISDLVGNDVVAHIAPSSITERRKIGEGEKVLRRHRTLTLMHLIQDNLEMFT